LIFVCELRFRINDTYIVDIIDSLSFFSISIVLIIIIKLKKGKKRMSYRRGPRKNCCIKLKNKI